MSIPKFFKFEGTVGDAQRFRESLLQKLAKFERLAWETDDHDVLQSYKQQVVALEGEFAAYHNFVVDKIKVRIVTVCLCVEVELRGGQDQKYDRVRYLFV